MKDTLKNNAIINLFISIIFIAIGIIFVTNPNGVLNIISYIIGGALLFFGATQVYLYFKSSNEFGGVNLFLVTGICSIAFGLIIILFSSFFEALIRIIIAFIIIYNGVIRLKISFDMKNVQVKEWIYMFAISLITILCGIYILVTSGIIFTSIGVVTIVYGILDLIQNIMYIKNINKIIK